MRAIAISGTISRDISIEAKLLRRRRLWAICLTASGTAASVTGMFGVAFSAAALMNIVAHNGRVSIFGNVLLAITFPLFVFAAHCLDKIDETNAAIRSLGDLSKVKEK